jgi:phosphoserine phosphatase RsbU/P
MDGIAHLHIIDGAGRTTIREIDKPRLVLGRNPDCDICINNLDASRNHAQIVRIRDEYFLEDLHSTNGTSLNDEPVHSQQKIAAGDQIRISDFIIEFHQGASPQAISEPASVPPVVSVDDESGDDSLVIRTQREVPFEASAPTAEDGAERSPSGLQSELQALLQISQSLRKSLLLEEVLEPILDTLFSIFPGADRGFFVLKNDKGNLAPRWAKYRRDNLKESIHISRSIVDKVMRTQQAVLSTDMATDERFPPNDDSDRAANRFLMCAPLIDGEGRSFGALQLDGNDAAHPFRESDLEIFVAVAIQTAIAIDNARLHKKKSIKENIESEREFADRLLQGILPTQVPVIRDFPEYGFYQYYCSAPHTGGDFYDYVFLYNGHLVVFMADTTGHGAAAAILIARLALEIRSALLISASLSDMMQNLNQAVFRFRPQDHFIKMVVAELIPASGEVILVNAGHQPPLLRRRDGTVSTLPATFCSAGSGQTAVDNGDRRRPGDDGPLGVADDAKYSEFCCEIPKGATLIFYTDGTAQATSPSGNAYGHERIRSQVASARGGPTEIGERLTADVRQFIAGAEQRDDICIVCLGRE